MFRRLIRATAEMVKEEDKDEDKEMKEEYGEQHAPGDPVAWLQLGSIKLAQLFEPLRGIKRQLAETAADAAS